MAYRLIINADDFGWSPGVNDAIAQLADEGVVTSTSLMVAAPGSREAVEIARKRPSLAVGLHLSVVGAPALLPPERIPHLAEASGKLPVRWEAAAIRFALSPRCRRDLWEEAHAQFKAFAALGIPWSHVDAHLHLSLHPVVFHFLLRLCKQYQVPALRVPDDDFTLHRDLEGAGSFRCWAEAVVLRAACKAQRPSLARAGVRTTRRCYGYFRSGRLDEGYLLRLVEALPEGDSELHCHPDLSTESGRAEVAALRSAAFQEALVRRGVQLAQYATLATS